jgi:hypothetical protein
MGLVLDSGVLIAAERAARPVSELLTTPAEEFGVGDITISSEYQEGKVGPRSWLRIFDQRRSRTPPEPGARAKAYYDVIIEGSQHD